MSQQPPKNPTAQAPARSGKDAPEHKNPHVDEDALHVPKGVSRGQFLFLVGLLIFLMVVWLVPGSILQIFSGSMNPVTVRFELPGGRQTEMRGREVMEQVNAIRDAMGVDAFLAFQLGVDTSKPDPRDLKRLVVLDRIAQDAGVEITNAELAAHLRETLGFGRQEPITAEDFKALMRARGLNVTKVENTIRLLLRVGRFQQLVGFAGVVPDPAKIVELWEKENVEFAFDYVTLPVADLMEEAKKELPDDAGLEAWFGKLGEGEKAEFKTAEKRKAELAIFRDAETTPAAELVAAYPEKPAEGAQPTPPEELANQYWRRVYSRRFAKEPAEGADPDTPPGWFSFEEVKERCLAEAPVYFAMQRWLEDLNARRTNGETIDFAAEAQELGLDHQSFLEPLSREQYAADDAAGDEDLAEAVFSTPPDGSFYASPVALPAGLVVVRANERTEPELPPFAEIRDRVAEKWLEPKCAELARKKLAAMRDGFEKFEPAPEKDDEEAPAPKDEKVHHRASAEAFQAAAQAAGLEVKARDYRNKSKPASKDLPLEDEERRALTSMASRWGLYELEKDEVGEPGLSADEKTVYLVRVADSRKVPIDDMTPTQYERYKQNARRDAMYELGRQMDVEYLRRNYKLWLYEESEEGKRKAAEAEQAEKGQQ